MLVVFQLLAVEGLAVVFISGVQQLRAGHHIILQMHIEQAGREGILLGLGGLEFGEFGFLREWRRRCGVDDFRFGKVEFLLHPADRLGLWNFNALFLELAGELFGFFLQNLALLFDAAGLIKSLQPRSTASLPPGEERFPGADGVA